MKQVDTYVYYQSKQELLQILKKSTKDKSKQDANLSLMIDSMSQKALAEYLIKILNQDSELRDQIQKYISERNNTSGSQSIDEAVKKLRDMAEFLEDKNDANLSIVNLIDFTGINPEFEYQFTKLFTDATNGQLNVQEMNYFLMRFHEFYDISDEHRHKNGLRNLILSSTIVFLMLSMILSQPDQAVVITAVYSAIFFVLSTLDPVHKNINIIAKLLRIINENQESSNISVREDADKTQMTVTKLQELLESDEDEGFSILGDNAEEARRNFNTNLEA